MKTGRRAEHASRKSYVIHRVASVRMCVVPSRPAVGSGRRACGRPLASHPNDGYGWVVVVCRYSERRGAVSSWSLARALYHITAAAGSHGPRRLLTRRFARLALRGLVLIQLIGTAPGRAFPTVTHRVKECFVFATPVELYCSLYVC